MTRAGLLLALLLAAAPVRAQDVPADLPPGITAVDRGNIRDVIARQLQAFRHDDAEGAYAFAAPSIRRSFPTAAEFMDMVRRGYPPVYRPRTQEFSELARRDGEVVQEVELVGPDGRAVLAVYTMERDASGRWLISACRLIPSVRVGA